MKAVAFGQYYPANSFVHRLDPRMKLLFLVAFIVAIFVANNFYGLAACAAVLVFVIAFSRVPFLKVLSAVKGIFFLAIFTGAINVLFHTGEKTYWAGPAVYWNWGIFCVSQEGIVFSVFLILRLLLLVLCSSMLTYTTTPVSLTDGIESILTPLKWVKFPVHALALIMSIALRMIPTLMEETARIKNAQTARGANFESGNLFKRIGAFIPVLIPLLLSAFRRADELSDAMEARCYKGEKRTKYKKLRFSWRDLVAFLVMAAMIAGVALLRVYLGEIL